jgi:hypothetical protein
MQKPALLCFRPGRLLLLACTIGLARAAEPVPAPPSLQQMVDEAPSNSIVRCDPNQPVILSQPVTIRKPLTLAGLRASLPEKLGNTSLIIVEAPGVAITDFELSGNADSVAQKDRAPLLIIHASDFRVERGVFRNSSKDGVMIDADGTAGEDIVGGVVRDIVGRGVVRDTVSISGSSGKGRRIRNVLVDNVRCYDSRLRGAVEVSDGTDNITVRKVYAESAVYAIDVQDHHQPGQSNRNVVVEDIYAVRCKHALRTANSRQGHGNLTIRNITAEQCAIPVQVSHTENVQVENVRVLNHTGKSPLQVSDCGGVTIRDVLVQNAIIPGAALMLENCPDVVVDGFRVRGTNQIKSAVFYRLTRPDTFTGLRIGNVSARGTTEAGVVLEAAGREKGTLTDYLITGNLTTVEDRIQGHRGVVTNNVP